MKHQKPDPILTHLDPNHPNHDAILLKRSRLEAHRRRRLENSGAVALGAWSKPAGKKGGAKPRGGGKAPTRKG